MTMFSDRYPREQVFFVSKAWFDAIQIIGASVFLALCSQISIPLFFSPIPITLQTFAVLLIGASMGSRKGSLAVLGYLAQIAVGLPVLSGGHANPLVFFSPKAGYILGFFLQAYTMGWVVEKQLFSRATALVFGGLLACTIQMAVGVCVFAQFVGWPSALPMGLYPFVVGEVLKIMAVPATLGFSHRFSSSFLGQFHRGPNKG